MKLEIGYSPCPNDTFIFHALTHEEIDFRHELDVIHKDVSTLNEMALNNELDIAKVSIHAYGHLIDDYNLLRTGGALGEDVGPILVSREPIDIDSLSEKSIVIPGELTTAYLLLRLFDRDVEYKDVLGYEKIMEAVQSGEYDVGLVIHEGRFTYPDYDLIKLFDLGEWWGKEMDSPVPLGGIAIDRDIDDEVKKDVERAIRESIEYGYRNPEVSRDYILRHAQEMEQDVIQRHIDLYVNDYSIEMDRVGQKAVTQMLAMAEENGFIPESSKSIFLDF